MTKTKSVSRAQLNTLVKRLPVPAQDHCRRCRHLAEYLVENIKTEEWFLDLNIKPDFLVAAVYYHDLGKSTVPQDYIYSRFCRGAEQKRLYRSHVEAGCELIEKECDVILANYKDRALEHLIADAINDHHENYDGSGFPSGKSGEEISLAGRITAIVDTFDNLLFFKEKEVNDFDKAFYGVMDEIIELSRISLDENLLVALIKDPPTLKAYIESMNDSIKRKRRSDKFGIRLKFHPIMNLSNRHGRNISGYIGEMVLNDPYYGEVHPGGYLHVANKTDQIFTLDKIGLEKLCALVKAIKDTNPRKTVPPVTFNVSYREFEKEGFYKYLGKLFLKYDMTSGQIVISVNEPDLVELHMDIKKIENELHSVGAGFAVNEFGSQASLLSSLDTIPIDQLVVRSDYTRKIVESEKSYDVISGMARIARKLEVPMVFTDVFSRDEEATIIRSGAKHVCGSLYGEPLSEKEFADDVLSGGGY